MYILGENNSVKMPKARFYLKKPNVDGECLIILKYTYKIAKTFKKSESRRLTYYTDFYIDPTQWNKRQQRLKSSFTHPQNELINQRLDELALLVRTIWIKYVNEHRAYELTTRQFKEEIDREFWGLEPMTEAKDNFFTWVPSWLEKYKNSRTYNENTHQNYNRAFNLLTEFKNEYGSFGFNDIDVDFFFEFIDYVQDKYNYADNTIIKYIERIRSILNAATEEGINTSNKYTLATNKRLGLKKTRGDKTYLTPADIKKIYTHKYSSERLRKVADLFCAACYLGLAAGDWEKINKDHIIKKDGKYLFEYMRFKGDGRAVIPAHPIVMEVIEKYNGYPPVISDQRRNDYLKEIGEEAGFNNPIVKSIKRKKLEKKMLKEWEMFICHVARNSLNSNALAAKIKRSDVKVFMGHKFKDMTEVYDRRDLVRIALSYADHPFFNE
jgi:hypothetical protein